MHLALVRNPITSGNKSVRRFLLAFHIVMIGRIYKTKNGYDFVNVYGNTTTALPASVPALKAL